MSFLGIGTIVSVVMGVLDYLFGDDSITVEELKAALDDAVEAIRTHTQIAIEEHELQTARDNLDKAIIDLGSYKRERTKDNLIIAEESARLAWATLNGDIDLIGDVKPGDGAARGSGLLGHYWFLIAASVWATALEAKIHYYQDAGSNDLAEGARQSLRDLCLDPSIEIAQEMQQEWVGWTRRRFSPLEIRTRLVGGGAGLFSLRCRWIYWFNGRKYRVSEQLYDSTLIGQGRLNDAVEQGTLEAEGKRIEAIEAEVTNITNAVVRQSHEVVREWRKLLDKWNLKLVPDEVFESFQKAADAAREAHYRRQSKALMEEYTYRRRMERLPPRLRESSMIEKLGLTRGKGITKTTVE